MPVFETSLTLLIAFFLLGYLSGTIPSGLIICRIFGTADPRTIGSGNLGATNVLRTGHKLAAALTLLADAAKGAVPILIARALTAEDAAQAAALGAFLGHLYPVWLKFKGGKGVATFLGVLLGLVPLAGLAACATWLLVAFASRYSSLSALFAAALSTCWVFVFGYGQGLVLFMIITVLIYIKHGENISRMRAGTEPKIGQSS